MFPISPWFESEDRSQKTDKIADSEKDLERAARPLSNPLGCPCRL
jgi:hypothetical protein